MCAVSQSEFYRGVERARQALLGSPDCPAEAVHSALQPLLDHTAAAVERACHRGCDHCCHFPVGVTFGEARRLVALVERTPELREHVLADALQTADLSWRELVGLPCPMLHNHECAAHAARPLPCRAMASSDAAACARALHGGAPPPVDGEAFWRGLGAAEVLADATSPPGTRELRSALHALLADEHEDAASAFLAARGLPTG